MLKVLDIQMTRPFLVLASLEFCFLFMSFYAGVALSWVEVSSYHALLTEYWLQATTFALVVTISLLSMGLYEGLLNDSFASILIRLALAFSLGFAILTALFYLFPEFSTWRSVTASALVVAFVIIGASHLVFMNLLDFSPLKRKTIVIGTGKQAARIQELEDNGRAYGFHCIGFVDAHESVAEVRSERILDNPDNLLALATRLKADEVVIAIEDRRNHLMMDQLVECGFRGIPVLDYLSFWERETKRTDLEALKRNWILTSGSLPGGRIHHFAMRFFDLTVGFAIFTFLAPVIAGACLAIKLGSPGPIFYRQERVGLRGAAFKLLKFRSMEVNAEADGIPQWSGQNDPRVTTIGHFIRKTRIDELPQILNVIKGEMKFVGPRPERPYFVEQLAREIPFYMQRFQVKPGITGWAQLNYPYGASINDAWAKLEYDLYYIKNYGLLLDLMIVLQTIRVILWPMKMVESEATH